MKPIRAIHLMQRGGLSVENANGSPLEASLINISTRPGWPVLTISAVQKDQSHALPRLRRHWRQAIPTHVSRLRTCGSWSPPHIKSARIDAEGVARRFGDVWS